MCRFFRIFIGTKQADMLPLQQTLQFSDYSELYDLIIPQDNLLRRINDLVDFSFIQKELKDKVDTEKVPFKSKCIFAANHTQRERQRPQRLLAHQLCY